MKIVIIINAERATDAIKNKIQALKEGNEYGIQFDVFYPEAKELLNCIQEIHPQSYNACLVGGGDGTVRTAVEGLIDKEIPLAIIPLGTFNLLAKTLEYPSDLDAIFKIIQVNKTKKIDIAEVNGHICINHAWIGFYYYMLKMREKHKEFLGRNKLLKLIFNSFNLFRVLPIYHLQLVTKNSEQHYRTCLLYVGNNSSSMNVLNFGERKTLSSGLLEVCILNCKSRLELLKFMLSMIFNQAIKEKYITRFNVENFIVDAHSKQINIVIDGELFKLETPLKFQNHKKQLTVITP